MDVQQAVDRILENENLTNNLEDDDAEFLLTWGTDHARALVPNIADDEQAGEKVNQLMAVMRSLNQIAGSLDAIDPDDLQTFRERYEAAFGAPAAPVDLAAEKLAALSPREAIEQLLTLVAPPAPAAAVEPPPADAAAAPGTTAKAPAQPPADVPPGITAEAKPPAEPTLDDTPPLPTNKRNM